MFRKEQTTIAKPIILQISYLFFDEIQEVTDWEKCVNSLRASLDCDIYVTGSNDVMANVGTTFSSTSLAKSLKNEQRTVTPETILNYIKYCCDAYLFYPTLFATSAERSCMSRQRTSWQRRKPLHVSLEFTILSSIFS